MVRRGGKSWNTPPHEVNPNKPDSPLSLMEGAAGVLCYLLDVHRAAQGASDAEGFPGWEI